MSMDHIKTVYRPPKRNGPKRTTYGLMTEWADGLSPVTAIPARRLLMPEMPFSLGSKPVSSFYNGQPQQMPTHLQYNISGGYDDAHKAFMKQSQPDGLGFETKHYGIEPPRLRNGRQGGSWRHIKNVLQAAGSRTVFVDGTQRIEDNNLRSKRSTPPAIQGGISVGLRQRTPQKKKKMHSGTGSFFLEAHQGTEKGNWTLMR
ncbi:hypothetical protein CAPTEDRAFT_219721 [Capitella teleta]|uniref:Uncharacterized protein n=1 Tax=Capitella teleta TaxID=283909 RepID=R7UVN7_CAPTE|nr:hypothetical protein CAPTEDRAFT_219721 [Capitella teleta]|eukprot:ELU10384.1 hypothetical protein CAPTEDRAFT_219721 [Capitella teleta]